MKTVDEVFFLNGFQVTLQILVKGSLKVMLWHHISQISTILTRQFA